MEAAHIGPVEDMMSFQEGSLSFMQNDHSLYSN